MWVRYHPYRRFHFFPILHVPITPTQLCLDSSYFVCGILACIQANSISQILNKLQKNFHVGAVSMVLAVAEIRSDVASLISALSLNGQRY